MGSNLLLSSRAAVPRDDAELAAPATAGAVAVSGWIAALGSALPRAFAPADPQGEPRWPR